MTAAYLARRVARSQTLRVRTLNYHAQVWGDETLVTPDRPPLMLVHGWMDVGASFQFVVDALAAVDGFDRFVIAPDLRGFGSSDNGGSDCYWFPDYAADLDALVDAFSPHAAVDLVGHSMGGNVVMSYAGARPERVRRLVNLEGFGMPRTEPHQAPRRLRQWLDELKVPQQLTSYAGLDKVVARLQKNNPRLSDAQAAWLAPHWARQREDGRWHVLGDAAHKRLNPVLYRVEEHLATWALITAPLLWVEGDSTDLEKWWGHRYGKPEFHQRLAVVENVRKLTLVDCGHMLHHDQPAALARELSAFLA